MLPTLAVMLLKGALRTAALPFSWPGVALRRVRGSKEERDQSAERAKFDTRRWTPALLKHLEWRHFEKLCTAWYEAQGFNAASLLLHCKPWDAYRVGIKPLRELYAAMAAAGVKEGLFITSSRFTQEAVAFAAKENIQLIDGAALLAKLAELPPERSLALLKLATQGDFLTPTCPCCSIKMISRNSTQGGRNFWGCLNYPRCKETFYTTAPA